MRCRRAAKAAARDRLARHRLRALFQAALPAFREGLSGQGCIEGENVAIAYRFVEGDSARLPALAAELVAMPVDVIVASGGQQPAQAAQAASRTISIVSTSAAPIVPNFARPAEISPECQIKPKS